MKDTFHNNSQVTIVEVGPRDGLQNEPALVPLAGKIAFVEALLAAGLTTIELTSFVNPAAVPQLADAASVVAGVPRRPGVRFPVLVPNERGLQRALAAEAKEIALFTAATDAFCQANTNCSIDESFQRFQAVIAGAKSAGMWIRGYVSVAFDCPFSGPVPAATSVAAGERLLEAGCNEICFADTIGTARVDQVDLLLTLAQQVLPRDRIALHFHDTHGNAIENVAHAWHLGCAIFDGAAGGLGGCPFAPGAPGNIATETLVEYFTSIGVATGIDATAVRAAAQSLLPTATARTSGMDR